MTQAEAMKRLDRLVAAGVIHLEESSSAAIVARSMTSGWDADDLGKLAWFRWAWDNVLIESYVKLRDLPELFDKATR